MNASGRPSAAAWTREADLVGCRRRLEALRSCSTRSWSHRSCRYLSADRTVAACTLPSIDPLRTDVASGKIVNVLDIDSGACRAPVADSGGNRSDPSVPRSDGTARRVTIGDVAHARRRVDRHRVAGRQRALRRRQRHDRQGPKVIDELGYESSLVARSLRSQRTNVIGILVAGHRTVQRRAPQGRRPCAAGHRLRTRRLLRRHARRSGLGAAIPLPPQRHPHRRHDPRRADRGRGRPSRTRSWPSTPTSAAPHLPTVDSQNFEGGVQATRHLIELGHRRIGFLAGRSDLESARRREDGYRGALAEAGIPFDPALIQVGGFTEETAVAPAAGLAVARPTGRRAIFAANDLSALQVLRTARELGLPCPTTCRSSASTTSPSRRSPTRRSPRWTSHPGLGFRGGADAASSSSTTPDRARRRLDPRDAAHQAGRPALARSHRRASLTRCLVDGIARRIEIVSKIRAHTHRPHSTTPTTGDSMAKHDTPDTPRRASLAASRRSGSPHSASCGDRRADDDDGAADTTAAAGDDSTAAAQTASRRRRRGRHHRVVAHPEQRPGQGRLAGDGRRLHGRAPERRRSTSP